MITKVTCSVGRAGLFEKADTVGGTSAWSGGTVWLPNNRHEAELGFSDSREEVLTYLMSLSHGKTSPRVM
jgi:3-oxosteroid 1-dehydrogenase